MERKLAYLCGLAFLVGCADSRPSPTLPSPTPTTPVTPRPAPCQLPCSLPGMHALSGVVRAAGVPLTGAQVGLIKLGPQNPVSPGPEELIASMVTDRNVDVPSIKKRAVEPDWIHADVIRLWREGRPVSERLKSQVASNRERDEIVARCGIADHVSAAHVVVVRTSV